jgi:hypothetical protein
MVQFIRILLVTLTVIGLGTLPLIAQQPTIRIVSPVTQSQVAPGQSVTITVQADPAVQDIFVYAQEPLSAAASTSSSNQFTLLIPTKTAPGFYSLIADADAPDGEIVSTPITLDVERSDDPAILLDVGGAGGHENILVQPTTMLFNVNDELPIQLLGLFSNGDEVDLTKSTKISFISQNPQIATVSPGPGTRVVKAVGAGETSMVITAGSTSLTIPVKVLPPTQSAALAH